MNVSDLIEHHNKYNLKERDKHETPGERYKREYLELKEKHKEKMRKQLLLETLKPN